MAGATTGIARAAFTAISCNGFKDLEAKVIEDAHPLPPGHVYDVRRGKLIVVPAAAKAGNPERARMPVNSH